jgi:hypothetical protein
MPCSFHTFGNRHLFYLLFSINGGMWGAIRGGFSEVSSGLLKKLNDTKRWSVDQDHAYMDDMQWLGSLWEASNLSSINNSRVLQHDSYCCMKFPGSIPLPTRRPFNFLHIGQVFDGDNGPRLAHIVKHFTKPAPDMCRGNASGIFG